MNPSPVVLSAGATITAVRLLPPGSGAAGGRLTWLCTPLRRRPARDIGVWFSVLVVVALWYSGRGVQGLAPVDAALTRNSWPTALEASDGTDGQVERARGHRGAGLRSLSLMLPVFTQEVVRQQSGFFDIVSGPR